MKWIANTPKETVRLGKKIGKQLKQNDVVTLHGTLGAGKTTFAKGIAEALGIREAVTSPTFTILSQYNGSLPLTHMDLYRLGSEEEFELLGGEDFFYANGVTLIEWSEKAQPFLPKETVAVFISVDPENQQRIIEIQGDRFESVRL